MSIPKTSEWNKTKSYVKRQAYSQLRHQIFHFAIPHRFFINHSGCYTSEFVTFSKCAFSYLPRIVNKSFLSYSGEARSEFRYGFHQNVIIEMYTGKCFDLHFPGQNFTKFPGERVNLVRGLWAIYR